MSKTPKADQVRALREARAARIVEERSRYKTSPIQKGVKKFHTSKPATKKGKKNV